MSADLSDDDLKFLAKLCDHEAYRIFLLFDGPTDQLRGLAQRLRATRVEDRRLV
jgi:hypothetical protein